MSDDTGAEERAWEVVRRAFAEREPRPRRSPVRGLVAAAAVVVLAAVGAAVLSPPGHAVFERVRRAVGVEGAAPALFSLPTGGQLLVVSGASGGTWVVMPDGAKRQIGTWSYAAWSPHGLYVVAATPDELAALDPTGDVRWTLPRRHVSFPTWEGTRTNTRIAYFAGGQLRVVAGDGTDDQLLAAHPALVRAAWNPARLHTLAYVTAGAVVLRDTDSGRTAWRHELTLSPTQLAWSSDGTLLAIVARHRVMVVDAAGRTRRTVSSLGSAIAGVAFRPGTHELAVSLRPAAGTTRSEVRLVDVDQPGRSRLLFAGPGVFGDLAWSPTGAWLLIDWPTANQWLFVTPGARPLVRAVANIDRQFSRPGRLGTALELAGGWCCTASG